MNGADFHKACTAKWSSLQNEEKAQFERLQNENRLKYEIEIKEYQQKVLKQKLEEQAIESDDSGVKQSGVGEKIKPRLKKDFHKNLKDQQ